MQNQVLRVRKILVVSAAFVVVFVLIVYGTTHQFFIPTPVPSDNHLSSEKGVDYTRLRDFLKEGKWKDADDETYKVMLLVLGGKDGDWITSSQMLNFKSTDLRTIDSLWEKYSNGRFGFSVQKKIYLCVGGKLDGKWVSDNEEAWDKFGDRVGWKEGNSWSDYQKFWSNYQGWSDNQKHTYVVTAPVGNLPLIGCGSSEFWWQENFPRHVPPGIPHPSRDSTWGFAADLFSRTHGCKL